jgi:CDP-diacylglycerol--serine O-phosphatidyltransferase
LPLANYFTIGNAFFGFLAIFFMFAGEVSSTDSIRIAGLCILIAAVFDFVDGFVARLTATESLLGRELDSLSDMVSFGVAPALLVFQAGGFQEALFFLPNYADVISVILLFSFVAAGLYRLARFNISLDDPRYFTGLPITASGLIIAFFAALGSDYWLNRPYIAIPLVFILSFLMVSKLRIRSLKKVSFKKIARKVKNKRRQATRGQRKPKSGAGPSQQIKAKS